jgi:hypothetical protein
MIKGIFEVLHDRNSFGHCCQGKHVRVLLLLLLRFLCAASKSIDATHPRVIQMCDLGFDL